MILFTEAITTSAPEETTSRPKTTKTPTINRPKTTVTTRRTTRRTTRLSTTKNTNDPFKTTQKKPSPRTVIVTTLQPVKFNIF